MKSPDFSERISLSKVVATVLSLLLIISVSSCTREQAPGQIQQLPSDQEISETIKTQLASSQHVTADEITVETKDGIVTLNGSTSNLLAKRKAEQISQSILGTLAVVNNLAVTTSRPDSTIDRDVDQALAADPATEGWQINSSVNGGVVTLKGAVDSWQERKLADAVASRVKGVKSVNNNIIVNYAGDRSDEEIEAEVERTLMMSSRIDGNMVSVNVNDRKVSLNGAIGSAYEKSVAKELAQVAGVESVNADRLEVHPEYDSQMFRDKAIETLTAGQIKDAINSALKYDPRVPEEKISVTINGDIAVLEGTVRNLNSKLSAGEDAQNTAGVNRVQNNIAVERKVVVTPDIPTTDEAIQSRIRNSIIRDPYVSITNNINISVDTGIVELTGNVSSQFEKDQIEKIAGNVKGVIAINNELTVGDHSKTT